MKCIKKLIGILCLAAMLLSLVACQTEPAPSDDTPPATTPNTPDTPSSGTNDGITDRSELLNGMTPEEKALFLWNGQFDDPEGLSSYTAEVTYTATGTYLEQAITTTATGRQYVANLLSDTDLFCYEDLAISGTIGEGLSEVKLNTKTVEGYAGGKMFSYASDDDGTRAVSASHTAAEYKAYRKDVANDDDYELTKDHCESETFEWIATGFRVTLSDFTDAGKAVMDESFGVLAAMLDQEYTDIELVLTCRRDLAPLTFSITYVYDPIEGEPTATYQIEGTYTDYNRTEPFAIDLTGYRDVGSLIAIETVLDRQSELVNAAQASYTYTATTAIKQNGLLPDTGSLTYAVRTENGDDGYVFSLTDSENGRVYTYENGVYTITQNGYSNTWDISDDQAKEMIRDFVDPLAIDRYEISNASAIENGYSLVFTITDREQFESLLSSINATTDDIRSAAAVVTYKQKSDGSIESFSYSVTLSVETATAGYTITQGKTISSVDMTEN